MKTQTKNLLISLEREAAGVAADEVGVRVPLFVLLGESIDVARFCRRYWSAERAADKSVIRSGLELAGESHLRPGIADEILVLHDEVQKTHTEYLLTVDPPPPDSTHERAVFVRDEIATTLGWLFDDDVHDVNDVQYAAVVDAHRDDPQTEDALAGELMDYVGLAERNRERLHGLGNFDAALIDEGKNLAMALRERSARDPSPQAIAAARLLDRRNRLATILQRRIARVRKAARFVFRHDPAILRRAASAYERKKRAVARRRAEVEPAVRPDPTTEPTATDSA